ncbi:L-rhamnose-binding lectin CSL3-like [Pimephales promelas]|uniref:L-rhamnose-binding lectin CSL3-like n=1 Tax=Pimephales promelas TaxID=90988 RepID=UPI00195574EB|nr:L-rhamnose-binding lectin CSL3-like [Pimephales promelas]KAG1960985.1 L-rhamnose-binding lectin CSL3 [Pimephales promelas]KAG1960987.1 L-rhamnose-binding lectin CSL3 [Pimephales promelas]
MLVEELTCITLLLFLYHNGAEANKKAMACEGESVRLKCDLGFIKIIKANYGRTDRKTCASGKPAKRVSDKKCSTSASLSIMSARCDGRKICTVPAENSVFTDPCPGTSKYLDISYDCIPAKRRIICENSESVIKCGKGVIQIHHANYGRRCLVPCPRKLTTRCDCYSPQTSSLRSRCDGKKSCQLSASNSVFADPCMKVSKYLEVTYSCKN